MSHWVPDLEDLQDALASQGYVARDWGLLGGALARPLTTVMGEEVYPTLWLKAAALLDSIERNHPFFDGNKRVGAILTALVLTANGVPVRVDDDDAWYDLILDVAAGHLEVPEIAERIQAISER